MAYNKNFHQDKGGVGPKQSIGPEPSTGPKHSVGPELSTGGKAVSRQRIASRPQKDSATRRPAEPRMELLEDLLPQLPAGSCQILDSFDTIVQGVRPLSSRQMLSLPEQIRSLSHLLTDQRGGRRVGYLNDPAHLSAYLRYFLWWNLLRLTKLFAGLTASQLNLPEEGVCVDIGSGPLTVPIALWLARPDLRKKRLTWYCIDYSQQALSLGEELYLAVAARTCRLPSSARTLDAGGATDEVEPWRIVRIKGELGVSIRQQAQLVTAANLFNEVVEGSGKPPEFTAKRAADIISHYAAAEAQVLVVEPGTPPSARFLTAFRGALARKGFRITAPCPAGMEWTGGQEKAGVEKNSCGCPMDGSRGSKWCHFTFSTEAAPAKLQRLSASAGLPKDRASLAFVLASSAGAAAAGNPDLLSIRIISEPINLPGDKIGHYGCCRRGLVLVVADNQGAAGWSLGQSQKSASPASQRLSPGKLIQVAEPANPKLDRKSGAVLVGGW